MDMKRLTHFTLLLLLGASLLGCDLLQTVEQKASTLNQMEEQIIALKMQAVEREKEMTALKAENRQLENQNKRMTVQLQSQNKGREIASIRTMLPVGDEDMVKFEIYQWTPEQILGTAQAEFQKKNFKKSAQYFQALSFHYPDHPMVKKDEFRFHAGVAAYEAGDYHAWTMDHLSHLVKDHPTSKYYRGAKLWMGLTHLQMGDHDKFFATVEEFRKKYRNTPEWSILSAHYEKIVQKYKN